MNDFNTYGWTTDQNRWYWTKDDGEALNHLVQSKQTNLNQNRNGYKSGDEALNVELLTSILVTDTE